jgi:hypothetical protein
MEQPTQSPPPIINNNMDDAVLPKTLSSWRIHCISQANPHKYILIVGCKKAGKSSYARSIAESLKSKSISWPSQNGFHLKKLCDQITIIQPPALSGDSLQIIEDILDGKFSEIPDSVAIVFDATDIVNQKRIMKVKRAIRATRTRGKDISVNILPFRISSRYLRDQSGSDQPSAFI